MNSSTTGPGGGADSRALVHVPDALWTALARAAHQLLMLDYDGTLAALVVERDRARPCARSLELLLQLAAEPSCRVAIVSGRPVLELQALLGDTPFVLVGEHGWESMVPGRDILRPPLPPAGILELEHALAAALSSVPAAQLERKRASLALHTRGLPEHDSRVLRECALRAWAPMLAAGPLELYAFHGGLELRARGRDKGGAVRALLTACPAGTLAVYVGDDETDEAAFERVRGAGFGIRVGPPFASTLATGTLADPAALAEFLAEWRRVSAARRHRG